MTENELEIIKYMARDGMSPEQIRKNMGIKRSEWNRYFKANPQELEKIKRLKLTTDYAVEDALLRRALGYSCEEHREVEKPNGCESVTTHKEVSPDVSAAALWLKCRRSQIWNDKAAEPDDSRIDEILKRLDEEAGRKC